MSKCATAILAFWGLSSAIPVLYADGVDDALKLYNTFQAETELGSHGYTIQFDQYSWEKSWTYGGRPQFENRYAARDALGEVDYSTVTPSGISKTKFTICSSGACDVPHEVRDYSCSSWLNGVRYKQAFINSDGDERLVSKLQYLVSHKYVINPAKSYREVFDQYGIFSVLEVPGATASPWCAAVAAPISFTVRVPFIIFPNSDKKSVLFKTTQSKNFVITSSSGIIGRLDPAVFK